MRTQQDEIIHDSSEYETHPLIVSMQEFLDYATHMSNYSALACGFVGLSDEMLEAVESVLDFATEMKTMYYSALMQETVEELLEREQGILDEIEMCTYSLTLCEFSLDKYLIFADIFPEIDSDFLTQEGYPLFGCAKC